MKLDKFIKYLETLPPETNVYVIEVYDCDYSYTANFELLDIEKHVDLLDLRNNPHAKGKSYENDVDLYLGEK